MKTILLADNQSRNGKAAGRMRIRTAAPTCTDSIS